MPHSSTTFQGLVKGNFRPFFHAVFQAPLAGGEKGQVFIGVAGQRVSVILFELLEAFSIITCHPVDGTAEKNRRLIALKIVT